MSTPISAVIPSNRGKCSVGSCQFRRGERRNRKSETRRRVTRWRVTRKGGSKREADPFRQGSEPSVTPIRKSRDWVRDDGGRGRQELEIGKSKAARLGRRPLQGQSGGALGDFAGGFFEEFVDEGLVGFGLLGGHAAEPTEQLRSDANGDELFSVSRRRGGRLCGRGAVRHRSIRECRRGRVCYPA